MPPERFYPLGKWFEFRPQLVPHVTLQKDGARG